MSFPTANLVAQYEPWRWTGYSDNDTINTTTKKVQDSSGNGNHLADFVAGSSVKYKTNILNGMAAVRLPGAHGDPGLVSGLFATGSQAPGTIAALIIPRETNVTGIAWCFHDGGSGGAAASHNGNQVYITSGSPFTGAWTNVAGAGFGTGSNTVTPVTGTAYVVWLDYVASGTNHLRVNGAAAGSVAGQTLYALMTRFTIGGLPNVTACWQYDLLALFIYSAVVTGSDATDLDAYLAQLQATGPSTAYTLTAAAGSFVETGLPAPAGYTRNSATGLYTLTGGAAHQAQTRRSSVGSFALTGAEAFETVVLEAQGPGWGGGSGSYGARSGAPRGPYEPVRPRLRTQGFRLAQPPAPPPEPPKPRPPLVMPVTVKRRIGAPNSIRALLDRNR